ncbi:MAG: hypothetical protein IRY91_13355 [Gemmatimonadaceae bacterium]|nr:hypothetical protein [Gemmatimonadaceae bacterium]
MINHIDLSSVLRRTVCDLYSDLVTRPTGAAVRDGIEKQLAELGDRTLTVIDFSHVGLLDYSCADEIVAKLLMRYCADAAPRADDAPPRDAYFLFRGVNDSHLDAIETVLERHGLAIVAEGEDGAVTLVGTVDATERRTWEVLCRLGRVSPIELAREVGLDPVRAEETLDTLCRRRLAMRFDESYVAVGAMP